jgi:hypothetical protein
MYYFLGMNNEFDWIASSQWMVDYFERCYAFTQLRIDRKHHGGEPGLVSC